MMQIFFLMLSNLKSVIDLKRVRTGSLKSKPDRRVPMVEYLSITPWMMFVKASLHRDIVYPSRSSPSRCIVGTGFLTSSFKFDIPGRAVKLY